MPTREDSGVTEPSDQITYLRECLAQRERELEAVSRITTALQARTSLDDLVRQTLITAVDTAHAAAGSVLLHDPQNDELVFRYVIGEKADVLTSSRMPSDQGVAGQVFRSGEARITLDAPADPAHFRRFDEEHGFRTQSMLTVPLKASAGNPIGVMQLLNKQRGVFTETDLAVLEILSAQAAGAIETARLHEEAKLAFVARTVGNISHDVANMLQDSIGGAGSLQNLLAAMFARLDALRAEPPPGDPWEAVDAAVRGVRDLYSELCQMMIDGAADVEERARQIVEAVRGELSPPEFRATQPVEIVERVLRALKQPAVRRQVQLALDAPTPIPRADLDRRILYNAIYNLVDNALDETPAGGSITVRLRASDDPEGSLCIAVADTGHGLAPQVLRSLFTDRVVTTKLDGTGLGTKIIKRAVDLHGGTIDVQSDPGEGTTFTLRLPLRQPFPHTTPGPS